MCGRYTLLTETYDLARWFELHELPDLVSRYNIAPSYGSTRPPMIVRTGASGVREMVPARWWLIPSWWKKPLKELPTSFNARSEKVATSPLFRSAFKHRRCLVPATGWYEFRGKPGNKESYYFHMPDRAPLAFGGIWDRWTSPEGEVVDSFAIVTTEPNDATRAIHDRMPLVLAPEHYEPWLRGVELGTGDMALRTGDMALRAGDMALRAGDAALRVPFAGPISVYRTRGFGNDPRREGPECIEPHAA